MRALADLHSEERSVHRGLRLQQLQETLTVELREVEQAEVRGSDGLSGDAADTRERAVSVVVENAGERGRVVTTRTIDFLNVNTIFGLKLASDTRRLHFSCSFEVTSTARNWSICMDDTYVFHGNVKLSASHQRDALLTCANRHTSYRGKKSFLMIYLILEKLKNN